MLLVTPHGYQPRMADAVLAGLLADLPGVIISGARATGKSTTAARHAASIVHLDDPLEAAQFAASPDAALAALPEPILLDEWQAVPVVLGAVKRAVDSSFRPGRFIVTGSVRDDLLRSSWPITGRLVGLRMEGLSVREVLGRDVAPTPFLRRVADDLSSLTVPPDPPNFLGYLELAVVGGFPEVALGMPAARRRSWYETYLERLLTHDVAEVDVPRDALRLRRLLDAMAINTAGEVTDQSLLQAAGIDRKTFISYENLLRTLLLIDWLPAWSSNRMKRLVRGPKRFIRDPGLAAALLSADVADIARNGNVLGRMIETFTLAQLRAEEPLYDSAPQLFHLREGGGTHEVDVVAELNFETIVGLEIKATAAPRPDDARHLAWLRDQLGHEFAAGVVLHTGKYVYPLGDRIVAAPIACIWS